jgi:hypothetical protein
MDRPSANLFALAAMTLACVTFPLACASTHCTPDGVLTIDGKAVTMTAVVSSASTRATVETAAAMSTKTEKKADATTEIAQSTPPSSNPATAGGGVAGGGDDGGLGDNVAQPGAHRRGLRWQSFLPGVIR